MLYSAIMSIVLPSLYTFRNNKAKELPLGQQIEYDRCPGLKQIFSFTGGEYSGTVCYEIFNRTEKNSTVYIQWTILANIKQFDAWEISKGKRCEYKIMTCPWCTEPYNLSTEEKIEISVIRCTTAEWLSV